jgi:hypothetical protein
LEDTDAEGRILFKWIFEKRDRVMNWIDLAEDKDRCLAVLNAVMNYRFP